MCNTCTVLYSHVIVTKKNIQDRKVIRNAVRSSCWSGKNCTENINYVCRDYAFLRFFIFSSVSGGQTNRIKTQAQRNVWCMALVSSAGSSMVHVCTWCTSVYDFVSAAADANENEEPVNIRTNYENVKNKIPNTRPCVLCWARSECVRVFGRTLRAAHTHTCGGFWLLYV